MSDPASDSAERPQARYRRDFRRRIFSFDPDRVLDVGCGEGGLLKHLRNNGVDCEGVDTDAGAAAAARAGGFDARFAAAESLPFNDQSFDFVVSEFSAHHFRNLRQAMSEAARVARRGVFILDQHYSPLLPGHALAQSFDKACKLIDRANGDVHHDAFSIAELVEALPDTFDEIDIVRLKTTQHVDQALARKWVDDAVAGAGDTNAARVLIDPLAARIEAEGLLEDGAVIICARRLAAKVLS
jgi:ubiquinone/menaquinone biosynthesis C-methylase UbiE